jgi:hypothetical protein
VILQELFLEQRENLFLVLKNSVEAALILQDRSLVFQDGYLILFNSLLVGFYLALIRFDLGLIGEYGLLIFENLFLVVDDFAF